MATFISIWDKDRDDAALVNLDHVAAINPGPSPEGDEVTILRWEDNSETTVALAFDELYAVIMAATT